MNVALTTVADEAPSATTRFYRVSLGPWRALGPWQVDFRPRNRALCNLQSEAARTARRAFTEID